jgi:replication factor A1
MAEVEAPMIESKVDRLTPASRQVNVTVKVVSKGQVREIASRRDDSTHKVSDTLVGDETGTILMTLWDEKIDEISDGDVLGIKNGYVTLFKGNMRLNIGRYGSFEKVEKELTVNQENNMSDKTYEEERRFGGGGGYGGRGGGGGGYGGRGGGGGGYGGRGGGGYGGRDRGRERRY